MRKSKQNSPLSVPDFTPSNQEDVTFGDLKIYSSEIKKLENKLIKISDKFIEDEISSIEYKTLKSRTEEKLFEMRQKQSELTRTISNLNISL